MCNFTPIFPQGSTVRPEELDKFFRPPLACVVLFTLSSIESLLPRSPVVWYVSFEDLEPANLGGCFDAVGIVRVAGEKPVLNALYDYAADVGCSFGLSKVSVEVDQKPLTPWLTDLASVQMGNSLDVVALRAKVRRAAASSLAYADG
jgi:hypothetical protein